MKRLILTGITLLAAGLGLVFFFSFNRQEEVHYLGQHAYLLESARSEDQFLAYCAREGIDYKKLVLYEMSFSVFKSGQTSSNPTLPVFDPSTIKGILAVYSSIPIQTPKSQDADSFRIEYDKNWFEKQASGRLEKPLQVKYLMAISDVSALPSQDLISNLKSDTLIETIKNDQNLSIVKQQADSIRAMLPLAEQDNLKKVVTAYCLWIKKNIVYPEECDKEGLRGTYINRKDARFTLENGVGVCEDNTALLKAFLNSQGIEAHTVTGVIPASAQTSELLPEGGINHAVVLIKTAQGYYLVDPTTQNLDRTGTFVLSSGKSIKASSKDQNENLMSFPMLMLDIEGMYMKPSSLTFKEEQGLMNLDFKR